MVKVSSNSTAMDSLFHSVTELPIPNISRYAIRGGGNVHDAPVRARPEALESDGHRSLHPRRGDLTATSSAEFELRALISRQTDSIIPTVYARLEDHQLRWNSPPYLVVDRNEKQLPRISFFPFNGLGTGVAMGLAFYQEGMAMKESSIELCLPFVLRNIASLPFILRWPGYMHIKVKKSIHLIDPDTGTHVTYGRIAQQVSEVFSAFIHDFSDNFDGKDGGIRLGPKAVTFHNLRLLQVYIRDDWTLAAEVAYTRRN